MILEGKKVRLRPVRAEDVDDIMIWINDPEVTRTLLTGRYPMTREIEQDWIEARSKISSTEVHYVIETVAGNYLGGCSLFKIHPVEHHAELGIVIGRKSEWGKGYAREATALLIDYGFAHLNLHMIYLTVLPVNPRAQAIYEKLGFVSEGTLRHRIYRDGDYHDLNSMSLLRSEWDDRRASS